MPETALNVLVNVLSRPVHFPKDGETGLLVIAEPPKPFVAPTLDVPGQDPAAIQKEILFIEASAAVGKSTLSRQLSATLKAPILDLAIVPVTAGSLHTSLTELEAADKSDPVAAFHEGRIPVIIDALDEGRLLSNETEIERFLVSSAEFLLSNRSVTSRPKLVFLARFESIELARRSIELPAAGITHATAKVEFFDKEGAWQLIQAYAAAAARPGSHYQQHPEAARDFIATYFDAIETVLGLPAGELWQNEQGRVFAGYAPVLAAMGSILAAIDNFTTVANNLKANGGREAWGVIEAVLYEILSREQVKLRNVLSEQCGSALPNSVYDAEEQLSLLAQYIESRPLQGTGRVGLPPADMEKYNDMIRTYLPHHPFIRRHEFGNAVLGSTLVSRAVYHGRSISRERLISLSRQWRQSAPTRSPSR
ncbi:MAG: hypothetical protein KGL62_17130 [Bradyrhizobium sp.]|uniref:hypothetical protein n=1 Tax=Bradyrhizobium sp. TaxID=376 RepID=UPI00239E8F0B|nr:hypothetical protein [Bradyrhizobium sp.]MDE2604067.1 hypothetical protein [Bradyrhizobium sp.]